MRPLHLWLPLALLLCLPLVRCSDASVKGDLSVKGAAISDVRVIVGTDKLHWPRLEAGETRRFATSATLPAEMTVLFRYGDLECSSHGPELTKRVHIQITIEPTPSEPNPIVSYRILASDP